MKKTSRRGDSDVHMHRTVVAYDGDTISNKTRIVDVLKTYPAPVPRLYNQAKVMGFVLISKRRPEQPAE